MSTIYIVTTGIFEGHVFSGTPIKINDEERIWDDDSVGRAYPAAHCKEVNDDPKVCKEHNIEYTGDCCAYCEKEILNEPEFHRED